MVRDLPSKPPITLVAQGMRVVDIGGKALGTVTDASYDEQREQLVSFAVQHGLFGRKHKPVPAHLVKQVAEGTVTLKFSAREFKELGDLEDQSRLGVSDPARG